MLWTIFLSLSLLRVRVCALKRQPPRQQVHGETALELCVRGRREVAERDPRGHFWARLQRWGGLGSAFGAFGDDGDDDGDGAAKLSAELLALLDAGECFAGIHRTAAAAALLGLTVYLPSVFLVAIPFLNDEQNAALDVCGLSSLSRYARAAGAKGTGERHWRCLACAHPRRKARQSGLGAGRPYPRGAALGDGDLAHPALPRPWARPPCSGLGSTALARGGVCGRPRGLAGRPRQRVRLPPGRRGLREPASGGRQQQAAGKAARKAASA
jgi:hypothetical protein